MCVYGISTAIQVKWFGMGKRAAAVSYEYHTKSAFLVSQTKSGEKDEHKRKYE